MSSQTPTPPTDHELQHRHEAEGVPERAAAGDRRIFFGVLAGGLTALTVAEALRTVRPWGIDVSSGVETSPGIKSERKLAALFRRVRQADREAE